MKCCIVIPIYRQMQPEEKKSYLQVLDTLNKYDIFLVTHKHCIIDEYVKLGKSKNGIEVRYFDACYFESIWGYNTLMLSKIFYKTFSNYNYMLIYQLDAYVFGDELLFWCAKEYDFIGAPINSSNHPNTEMYATEMNGGLSLRRTASFLNAYKGIKWYKNLISVSYKPQQMHFKVIKVLLIFIQAFVYKHSLKFIIPHQTNEDLIWSRMPMFTKVPYIQAIQFSFERNPQKMYDIIQKKPFGCHAWSKYEKDSYWNNMIN